MKFLHTSDWHLGQNLFAKSRIDEHKQFFTWLIDTINKEQIDLLIISGDIFDTGTPPTYAQKLYYNFISNLTRTCCNNAVIIAGNHDSPSTLNASASLLENLKIHVVGKKTDTPEKLIYKITNKNNEISAIVCAIPFLRDRDIRNSIAGESYDDKNKALVSATMAFYQTVSEQASNIKKSINSNIPIIATGHLYASKTKVTESVRDIYVGNLYGVNIADMANNFDYIALGHLHIAQRVSKMNNVRYSGSPIPMSFDEAKSNKIVIIGEFNSELQLKEIEIPNFQPLILLKGSLEYILDYFSNYQDTSQSTWFEIQIKDEKENPIANNLIIEATKNLNIEILAIKSDRASITKSLISNNKSIQLSELKPIDVFKKRLEYEKDMSKDELELLSQAFSEVLNDVLDTGDNFIS